MQYTMSALDRVREYENGLEVQLGVRDNRRVVRAFVRTLGGKVEIDLYDLTSWLRDREYNYLSGIAGSVARSAAGSGKAICNTLTDPLDQALQSIEVPCSYVVATIQGVQEYVQGSELQLVARNGRMVVRGFASREFSAVEIDLAELVLWLTENRRQILVG